MATVSLILRFMVFDLLFVSKVFSQSSCITQKNLIKNVQETSCVHLGLTAVPLKEIPLETGILILSFNALKSISTSSFKDMKQLVELDLSDNHLTSFQANLRVMLEELNLANNLFKSIPDLFHLSSLTKLVLSNNLISTIPETSFKGLKNLKVLELQKNRIDTLSEKVFNDLVNLKHLDLSYNQLWQLPDHLISSLERLEKFCLTGNRLTNIPDGFFDGLDSFAYVYFDKNPWICNCTLSYFKEWVENNEYNIYELVDGVPVNDGLSVLCADGTPLLNYNMDICFGNHKGEEYKSIKPKLPSVEQKNAITEFPDIMEETTTVAKAETTPTATRQTRIMILMATMMVMEELYPC